MFIAVKTAYYWRRNGKAQAPAREKAKVIRKGKAVVWRSTDAEERAKAIEMIGRTHPSFRRDPARCVAESLDLPFYPGGRLIRLSARDVPGSILHFALLPERAVPMNEGLSSVNQCNSAGPLLLTTENIHDYVRFYCHFARGAQLFESRVKRSPVGFSGKIWIFERGKFFEIDTNVAVRGLVVELEKTELPDVPPFEPTEFDL